MYIGGNQKLSPKYYGPFHIMKVIGKVAYKLNLPSTATIHDVFHVSQLKAFHGTLPLTVQLPNFMQDSTTVRVPSAILDRRVQKIHIAAQVQFLVQWKGSPRSEATWESAVEFVKLFPDFNIN